MSDTTFEDFLEEIDRFFKSMCSIINPLGQELSLRLTNMTVSDSTSKVYVIAYDILKRIRNNITLLQFIKVNETSCVAYRLLLRSITADVIETLYILTLPDEEREAELWKRGLEYVVHLNLFGNSKYEFFESRNPNSMKNIDLKELKKIYPEYVDPSTDNFYSTSGKNRKMSTANMLEHLAKRGIFAKEYQQLYSNYKILSFTEHYCHLGRRYSNWHEQDHVIILDIIRWLYVGIDTLGKIVREWIDTGNFVSSPD